MEVPYEREEEEVMGIDLETTKRKRSQIHHKKKLLSPTSSESSSVTSESSNDTGIEYFASMNSNNNASSTVIITNGENQKEITEVISVIEEEEAPERFGESNNVAAENEGTNGFHVQNNVSTVVYSLHQSDAGDKEMDVGSNGSSYSKSPDTAVGLKYVETLLDENSDSVNLTPPDTLNPEISIVNEALPINGRYRDVGIHLSKEPEPELEPEAAEFDVERVIQLQTQETHDLYCPNCNSCITRVILRKRKRKPSPSEEGPDSKSDQTGSSPAPDKGTEPQVPSGTVDAISCFSCFRFFIPSGEGFLCWRFKPKPDVVQRPGSISTGPGQVLSPATEEPIPGDAGHFFPLWIVTCCQPSHTEKPVTKPGSQSPPTSENDTQVPPGENESPLPPSDDSGTTLQNNPRDPIKPDKAGESFPLWFLTCCQPSSESTQPVKPDAPVSPKEPSVAPSDNIEPTLTPPDDKPVPPPEHEPPVIPVPGVPSTPKPIPPVNDIPSAPEPEGPTPAGSAPVMPVPPQPQPPVLLPYTPGVGTSGDIESVPPRESPRPGGSGLDIIKAIVYGGLLECITSLSVISSAAGGDATTLNIVALGLANVFGGLIVLVHSLRLLNHEHTNTDHYEAQLGRPGHYQLHAFVAIISYLVFGLIPPIIYGFTFRKSDNKDYKLATLAAASLACIAVLSAAKAYVRSPPKYMKTVFYYVSLGFMVSGVGYVAGDLINMLLIKLGVFDSRAPASMSMLKAGAGNGAWSSY